MSRLAAWRGSSNPSRTTARAGASTSSIAWPARSPGPPSVYLLDRTSDASHNRSVLTLAGEAEAVTKALEATRRRSPSRRSTWSGTSGEHPRIGAVDVVPFVPLGATTMDECVELARAFGARIADRFGLPVYLYARAATRPDRVKLADVRRGQYEGLKAEIGSDPERQPDFGPARMHPAPGRWRSAPGRSSSPRTSTSTRPTSSSPGGSPGRSASPAAGCRSVQANGFRLDGARPCAQVSMNLLDFEIDAALAGLGGSRGRGRGADGVELAESELIGLAPLAAFLAVADRRRRSTTSAGRRPGWRRPRAYLRLRDFSPLQALELRLAAARGEPAAAEPPTHRGRPRPTARPGPAGRRRARRSRRWPAGCGGAPSRPTARLLDAAAAGGTRRPGRPGRRLLGGPDPRGRAARGGRVRSARGGRLAAGPVRADRRGRRRPSRPGLVDPHTHLLFGGLARGRARAPPARRRLPRDPRGRRRDPVDGRGHPGRLRRGPCRARPALARRDASPRRRRRSRRSPATGSTCRRSCACSRSPTSSARRGRSTSCRRGSAPTPSRPSSAPGPTAPRRTSGTCSRSSCPASRPRAGPGSPTCSASGACSAPTRAGAILEAAAASGMRPRLHADELAPSGGAELAAELGAPVGRPPRRAVDGRDRRAGRGRRARAARSSRTLLPATTWFLMKPTRPRRRGRFIERGVPVALGTDFNPGTSPTPSLPLVMTVACLELGLTPAEALAAVDDQRRACPRARRRGRLDRARQAGGPRGLARPDRRPDPVLAGAPTSSGRSSSAAGVGPRHARSWPSRRRRAVRASLAARLEEDAWSSRSGRLEIVTAGAASAGRWASPPISWRNVSRASAQSGLVLADRHRDDDLGVELGDQLGGLRGAERAADRHAGDVDRADVAELLLGQQVADVAEVDRVDPSSSTTNAVCRPRSAPFASSR